MFSAKKNLLYNFLRFFHVEAHEEKQPDFEVDKEEQLKLLDELSVPLTTLHINPLTIDEELGQELGHLLTECVRTQNYYLKKGLNIIKCKSDGIEHHYYLHLTHPLVYRVSESDPHDYRFEVVGKEIGVGAFSHVYLSLGTLVPDKQKGVYFKPPRDDEGRPVTALRIIKEQTHSNKRFPPDRAVNEVKLGKLTSDLGGKQITFLDTYPVKTIMVENFIQGTDLLSFLTEERSTAPLTPQDREELALEILYAIREQVHDHGIVHRDIKPENILVMKENGHIRVVIIDFGLSQFLSEAKEKELCGTLGYTAPEIYAGKRASLKSDVYSAGIVESLVWGADTPAIINEVGNKKINIRHAHHEAENYKFPKLLQEVTGFEANKASITTWLTQMTHKNVDKRYTLDEAIEELEAIVLERKKMMLDSKYWTQLDDVYAQAICIRRHLATQQERIGDELRQQIETVMGDWHESVTAFFLRLLHIPALYHCKNKAEVLRTIDDIMGAYEQNLLAVSLREHHLAKLPHQQADHLLTNHRYILEKCAHSRMDLNEMQKLSLKLQKRLKKPLPKWEDRHPSSPRSPSG